MDSKNTLDSSSLTTSSTLTIESASSTSSWIVESSTATTSQTESTISTTTTTTTTNVSSTNNNVNTTSTNTLSSSISADATTMRRSNNALDRRCKLMMKSTEKICIYFNSHIFVIDQFVFDFCVFGRFVDDIKRIFECRRYKYVLTDLLSNCSHTDVNSKLVSCRSLAVLRTPLLSMNLVF